MTLNVQNLKYNVVRIDTFLRQPYYEVGNINYKNGVLQPKLNYSETTRTLTSSRESPRVN